MLAAGEFSNLVFEFLHGLLPHAPGTAGEGEAEKLISLSIGGHFRFLLAQLKAELLLQHVLHKSQCLFGLAPSWTEDHEVVGVSNEPKSCVVHLPIQVVEDNVGQEWGNDPTLWGANGSGFKDSIVHHTRREKVLDKAENVAVSNTFGHRRHNDFVRKVVKEAADVGVHQKAETFIVELENRLESH